MTSRNEKLRCQKNPVPMQLDGCDCLAEMMRKACPKLGEDWMSFLAVMVQPGGAIKPHKHRQHTVLYYPKDCPAVMVKPSAGTMLYLPPGVVHGVTTVAEPRLSVAMLIEDKPCKST